ncbi:hypothetical protein ABW19_dt0203775 [Dactylella cylindrospora]|nr:hypothetical protein ABW19_dt0203775 [Dactylella cylindrospora]
MSAGCFDTCSLTDYDCQVNCFINNVQTSSDLPTTDSVLDSTIGEVLPSTPTSNFLSGPTTSSSPVNPTPSSFTTITQPPASNTRSSTSTTSSVPESSTPAQSSGGSSTPVGPIVGGVVGGLVAIAAIVCFMWLFVRERRKKASARAYAAESKVLPVPPAAPVNYGEVNGGAGVVGGIGTVEVGGIEDDSGRRYP